MRYVLSLIFVLALIGLFAWLLRKFGPPSRLKRGGTRRLSIVEIQPIDARRRLVLVRRDDREHLILLGIGQDLVIEAGIAPPRRDFAQHLPGETS
jgi:flagellar protein FliO/FliZ